MTKYRFERSGAILEIEGNNGRISLVAANAPSALGSARKIFRHMRDVSVAGTADRYVVSFKVDVKYDRAMFKAAQKIANLNLTRENYQQLKPHEKYMALLYAQLTGKETFLNDPMFLRGAILALKNELVSQGHVSDPDQFMTYDIAVFNAVESQS